MAEIPLSGGRAFAIVDDEDADRLQGYAWYLTRSGYAWRTVGGRRDRRNEGMHRVILNAPKGSTVDHINRNPLDNRKANLRLCTHSQNSWNSGYRSNNTSGYRGVMWIQHHQRWAARIAAHGRRYHLGEFRDARAAALAYNEAALRLHGEFAVTNTVPDATDGR